MNKKSVLFLLLFVCSCASHEQNKTHERRMSTQTLASMDYSRRNQVSVSDNISVNEELINDNFVQSQLFYLNNRQSTSCFSTVECTDIIYKWVSRNLNLPHSLAGLERKSVFTIKMNDHGVVYSAFLVESSGDPLYDYICSRALTKRLPFPLHFQSNSVEIENISTIKLIFSAK